MKKKFGGMLAVLFLALLTLPGWIQPPFSELQLNQYELQALEWRYRTFSPQLLWDQEKSFYSHWMKHLLHAKPKSAADFEKPESVLKYIFERLPPYAFVYPTETYYYFRLTIGDKRIGGNMRLLDAEKGLLHLAYYDRDRPHGKTPYRVFSEKDGLILKTIAPDLFQARYQGQTIHFRLSDFAARRPSRLHLLEDEEWITRVHDESGIRLHLIYFHPTQSFYYILDEESGVPEHWEWIREPFYIGKRTGFVIYEDRGEQRRLLVGVDAGNIFENNYFDGPFDQVPPRLTLREKLLAAYPYTGYAGGIDAHGNFLGFQQGSRVAISPYVQYEDSDDVLISLAKRCSLNENRAVFWSCLTYEAKKDFHKTLSAREKKRLATDHVVYVSQGWPANHEGVKSLKWPDSHQQTSSHTWPRDHQPQNSKKR